MDNLLYGSTFLFSPLFSESFFIKALFVYIVVERVGQFPLQRGLTFPASPAGVELLPLQLAKSGSFKKILSKATIF
ncbi:hypothetical protein AB986_14330 [Alkalihalobacillus macyae]|uniref:Uncharacterized protein n=1 Tax=Guptibacillus hwajinpoensis TaxID=208199 RepID=A0A0J6CV94_9BACL|nr:hypothetical protein AB986_14330 [Alkalihalobacillus macyae]